MPTARTVAIILSVALGVRIAAAVYWHNQALAAGGLFRLGDSDGYWHLAKQIAGGQPYQYGSPDASIFRAPLLPLLLAPVAWILPESAGVFAARLMGCGLGTLAVWLVMRLSARVAQGPVALLAGMLAAIAPGGIGMSIAVLSEMLMVPLLLLYLLAWQRAWSSQNGGTLVRWGLASGAILGLATLARPSCLLLLPFITVMGLIFGGAPPSEAGRWGRGLSAFVQRSSRGRHAWIAVLGVLGLSLCMLPWWLRNAAITGRFVPTTLQVGASLLDGLHPGASGASDEGMAFMREIEQAQRLADQAATQPPGSTFEYRINQRAMQRAIDFAVHNPTETLRLAIIKFGRTWSLWPDGGELSSTMLRLAITLSTFGILLLAIWGSCVLWPTRGWLLAICWMPCLYFTLLHMLFVGSIRYREPAIFVLIALAGVGLADGIARIFPRLATEEHTAAADNSRGRPE
jgi:hypothetical protein